MAKRNAGSMLEKVKALVAVDRDRQYGDKLADMQRAAIIAGELLGREMEPQDIVLVMLAVKLSRLVHANKADSWCDVAGWAAVGYEVDSRGETDPGGDEQ